VSDADITDCLLHGSAIAFGITGKTDWETDLTNPFRPGVISAIQYFAASEVRDRFQDQTDVSTELFNRATSILEQVTESMAATGSVAGGAGSGIAIRQYRTYPLNQNAVIYRSLVSPGSELVGSESLYTSDANIPQ
jgi:hypothetical protein